jgi:amidase
MTDDNIVFSGARRLAAMIRARKLSATEVMQAFIAQIERVNPKVNAIVTFLPEAALAAARKFDRNFKSNKSRPLAGLPIAYKDNVATRGIRTTSGSPIYKDNVPKEDHVIVERLTAAGAITLGKTNLPEFAAGSHTFNTVFGATLNPYDLSKSAGGSSGGAAAAVASGMLPFADGGDLAASLRNPGNFCNVVGFRPTPGRVPHWPAPNAWNTLGVLGPIARTVEDAAFLLSAMAGPDARAPTSITEPGKAFASPLSRKFRKTKIAWSRNLGGLPMDPRVTAVLEKQKKVFKDLGCIVEEAEPDFSGATEAFETMRAVSFVQNYGELVKTRRREVKDAIAWNVEQGWKLTTEQIARAETLRNALYHRMRVFLERYEFLLCPVNQLPPFPAEQEYPTQINGVLMGNYLDWMKSCYYITITSHPAISVPAGFTNDATPLPVGLQIVGRYRDDFGVLQLAHAFEQETKVWRQRPSIATA